MMPWLRWGQVINVYLILLMVYAKHLNPEHGVGLSIMLGLLVSFTIADFVGGYLSYKAKLSVKGDPK